MNYNLIYVQDKKEERIEISEDNFTVYSNDEIIKEDFEVLKNLVTPVTLDHEHEE